MSSTQIAVSDVPKVDNTGAWIWMVVILIIIILAIAIIIIIVYFRRPTAPIPPTNLQGTVGGTNTISLTWTPPVGFQPVGYLVYFDTQPNFMTAMVSNVGSGITSFSVQVAPGIYYMSVASQANFTGQTVTGPLATPIAGPLVVPPLAPLT